MSDPRSPRRRAAAPQPPSRGGGNGGGSLPFAAILIGVVIAGLGIGALGSALMNRNTQPGLGPTSAPIVTPVPQPSPETPLPTLAPTEAPTPSPSPTAAPPTPKPTRRPTPAPLAAPSVAPSQSPPPPTAALTTAPRPATAPPSAVPAVVPTAALRTPVPAVKPVAVAPASVPPVRPVASTADASLAVVRRYLESLMAGDETTAYTALGGTSSDRSLDLKEEAFLEKDARITSMRASHSDATSATVDAEITTSRGSYVATFHVTNGVITQHDYIKI